MFKAIRLTSIFLVVLLWFSGCADTNKNSKNNSKEQEKISIKAGNNDITPNVISKVGSTDETDSKPFETIAKKGNIPYVKLGDTIQIELENTDSNTYTIKDYILNRDGTIKYNKGTIKTSEIKFNKGLASFVLDKNLAAGLSSNSNDYEPGNLFRGFRIICSSKGKEHEYSFVIRTDAEKSE